MAKAFYDVGSGSKVDYINAKVDYNGDTAAYIAQVQNLNVSKIDLNALLARDAQEDFTITDTTITRRDLSVDDLRQRMLAQNPNLVFAAQQRRLAELNTKALTAQQFPRVDLLGGFAYTTSNNQAGFGLKTGRNDIWSYGARVSVNVFDGFNQKRRIQNARINTLITEDQESDVRNQLMAGFDRTFPQLPQQPGTGRAGRGQYQAGAPERRDCLRALPRRQRYILRISGKYSATPSPPKPASSKPSTTPSWPRSSC